MSHAHPVHRQPEIEIEIDTDADYFCPVCEPNRTDPVTHKSPLCTGHAHPRDRASVSTHPRAPRREPEPDARRLVPA